MMFFTIFTPVIFAISSIVLLLSLILSYKTKNDREKGSPFECGFDANANFRVPFSLRFFLITIIFLIFDVEIVMLMPSIKSLALSWLNEWLFIFFSFMIILLLGLLHEWNQGALNWTI